MTNTDERKCGECLMERAEIVQLVNGLCPECGTDYREPVVPAPAAPPQSK